MAHEEIYRELAEARETGELVAYHKWGDDPSIFLVGRVLELSPTSATFEDIDSSGRSDENMKVPLRLIHTIDRGTIYLWRLQVLCDLGAPEGEKREVTKPAEVKALLEKAAREGWIVTVWSSAHDKEDDCLILAVGEETVSFTLAFDGGPANGRTMMRLDRIKRVRYGRGERNDTLVHRHGLTHGFPGTNPR